MADPKPSIPQRVIAAIRHRFTVAGTREASWIERQTFGRLGERGIARLSAALELIGTVASFLLIAIFVAAVFGIDWQRRIQDSFNQGEPVQRAVTIGILLSILSLVALRSVIGFFRWRVQRELWRRDAAALAAERNHDR